MSDNAPKPLWWKLEDVPRFVGREEGLREADRADLEREYRALFSGMLHRARACQAAIRLRARLGDDRRVTVAYSAPSDVLGGQHMIGLRYFRLTPLWEADEQRLDAEWLGAVREPLPQIRKLLRFTVAGDVNVLDGDTAPASPSGAVDVLPYAAGFLQPGRGDVFLIPSTPFLPCDIGDTRWLSTLSVLVGHGQPGQGICISLEPAAMEGDDIAYAFSCIRYLLATYSGHVEYQELRGHLRSLQAIAAQHDLYRARIFAGSPELARAFIEDMGAGTFTDAAPAEDLDAAADEVTWPFVRDVLPDLLSGEEAMALLLPPFTFRDALPGVRNSVPKPSVVPEAALAPTAAGGLFLGTVGGRHPIKLPQDALTRHVLICGQTGSGKTHTARRMLAELSPEVPFLVIDPVKDDYGDLQRPLPGREQPRVIRLGSQSPPRLAVLQPFTGVSVQALTAVIARVFSLLMTTTPTAYSYLLGMLRNAYHSKLEQAAAARGLPLRPTDMDAAFYGSPRECSYAWYYRRLGRSWRNAVPTLEDVRASSPAWLEAIVGELAERYGTETRAHFDRWWRLAPDVHPLAYAILGGGQADEDVPSLFRRDTIVLLGDVADEGESNAMVSLFLFLLAIYRRAGRCDRDLIPDHPACSVCPWRGAGPHETADRLRHVTLIEEAHRVMPRDARGHGKDVVRSPEEESAHLLSQMLSELRSYGEGFIIAEQSPSKLIADAMINTGTKILRRLAFGPDIEAVAESIGLPDREAGLLSRLSIYDAVVMLPDADDYTFLLQPFRPL